MADLTVEHLSVSYRMKRTKQMVLAVDDVSFSVKRGEFVTIVGPSGCGKTTILNAIAGILPVEHQGRVSFNGAEVHGPGRDRAVVFQSPALLPWRSVIRNVAYGLELQGVGRRQARSSAQEFITLVGLRGFEESYPGELSGGMQQRANLARALAVQPQLLLLDEPLAALDSQMREAMQVELQRIWLQDVTTAVYVTHQIREAIFLGDRVLVMSGRPGRIKQTVPVELHRPRTLPMLRSDAFIRLEEQVWELLHLTNEPEPDFQQPVLGVANGT